MGIARLTTGLLLILGVVTLTGATTGVWIGSVAAEDHGDSALGKRVRDLKVANKLLEADVRALRDDLERRQAAQAKVLEELAEREQWAGASAKRAVDEMASNAAELLKSLKQAREAVHQLQVQLQAEQEGRTRDIMSLQAQLSDACSRGQRASVRLVTAQNACAKKLDDLNAQNRYLLGFFVRVGGPAVKVLVGELAAHPKESGRWIFPLLERMIEDEASAAIPVLERLADDEALVKNGVAARAQRTLEILKNP